MVPSALRRDARANRERLLAAAVAVFAEAGPEVDLKVVADRAALAVGTIYRHFPSKDDLILAVMEQVVQDFRAAIDEGLAEPDPLAGLTVFVHAGVAVVVRYGELMAALLDGRMPGARTATLRAARRAGIAARLAELVRRGIAGGLLRAELHPEGIADALRAALTPWVLGELGRGTPTEQIAPGFLDLFLNGTKRHRVGGA